MTQLNTTPHGTHTIGKLQTAAEMIALQYGENAATMFQGPNVEQLSEGFHFVRLGADETTKICQELGLNPFTVELGVMLLNQDTAGGRSYSLPHRHADSTTYVRPLGNNGGTYLPQGENELELDRIDGPCVIDGSLPHAFVSNAGEDFMAVIAVSGSGETQPIANDDGTYNTQILNVKSVTPDKMQLAA